MSRNDTPEYENSHIHCYEKIENKPTVSRRAVNGKSSIALLMVAAGGLMIVDISIHHLIMSSLMFFTAIVIAIPKEANKLLTNFEKLQRKMGINLYGILLAIVVVIFMLDFATAPASAQFLNNAETWMTGAFTGISADAIKLVFNVLRGLFLVYLGISLVRIVNANRNDEDWQNLARTPLIIAMTVVIGDILAGLVTGGGAGTGTV
ncbi:MAG: hypothetical protein KME28_26670 [Pelatocladus maniniholoensis HA4357-MV3]|jgi:hypothetical protein|uniref:Uncharacterized protein n=1 Tax=Pelatocladus maniniholoensis HA4357-MV3 TaxID=1117104 RepID=A0A9E3HDD3_9NOST|nr:hypothetical protein [Pelatocladus maniniholoensis HA4357-MV3]